MALFEAAYTGHIMVSFTVACIWHV